MTPSGARAAEEMCGCRECFAKGGAAWPTTPESFRNACCANALILFGANAVAQAVKPWLEARQVQVDALHRLGLLGSPVEELERMAKEIARLREFIQEIADSQFDEDGHPQAARRFLAKEMLDGR